MRPGVTIGEAWPVQARLLAEEASHAGKPGRWTGRACPDGGDVSAAALADLVARFGAFEMTCAGTDEEGERYADASPEDRQRMRARALRDFDLTFAALERTGRAPAGAPLGTRWTAARFFHEYDDHTRQRRLHAHYVVVTVRAGDPAMTAAARD